MKSSLSPEFVKLFRVLPESVRQHARRAYKLFKANPNHPGLQFKRIQGPDDIYSVRIGLSYRALGTMDKAGDVVWYWIGSHAEYDKLVK
jgi:hypothetical protein